MPSATAVLPPSFGAIAELFDIEDAPAVRSYLGANPSLVPLLVEARRTVPRFFPGETRVRLQVLADRDDEDHTDLFAIIQTALPEDDALRCLDRFDEEWWLDAAGRAGGRLTIDVESVS
jgi:hypothetical protein